MCMANDDERQPPENESQTKRNMENKCTRMSEKENESEEQTIIIFCVYVNLFGLSQLQRSRYFIYISVPVEE